MRPPRRPRRSGTTLMEVLIAIFIMALGLMALLTLFPLGLLQMAASIKDDQCARGAANAEATMRYGWKQIWDDKAPSDATLATTFPLVQQLDNFGRVYVDPIGDVSSGGNSPWLAGQVFAQGVGTPRSSIAIGGIPLGFADPTPSRQMTRRFCSLLDDITFDRDGAPDHNGLPPDPTTGQWIAPGTVRREGRYNFAWLLTRRPLQTRSEANLTVVLYGGLKGARSIDLPSAETAYPAVFIAGQTTAYLRYYPLQGQDKPKLSRNSWLYDNANGQFYRVVDVNEDLTTNIPLFQSIPDNPPSSTVIVELQTPAIANVFSPYPPPSGTNPDFVPNAGVVMELIAEVFDKGTISPFTVPELQP